jgi:probable HAF family extracellular repeat protein
MTPSTLTCTVVMFIFALSLASQAEPAHSNYTIVDLGTLGGNCSFAFGIDESGKVDGFSNPPGQDCFSGGTVHAFVWQNGVMTDLGTLGGPNSLAAPGPSERGVAVGLAETSTADPNGEDFCGLGTHLVCLPFLWQSGTLSPLAPLGGNNGQASDINSRGEVVGWAETTIADPDCPSPQVLQFKPVVWLTAEARELPTFPGDPDGVAFGINDRGRVVGASGPCAAFDPDYGASLQPRHALMWHNGTVTALGNLGGNINNVAFAIDNLGQVVGTSGLQGDTANHAFLWQNGVMTDLGTLPGDVDSGGLGIRAGRVVGGSFDANGNSRAFIWENGVMTDLNALVFPTSSLFLLEATAINARGEIAGFAFQTNTGGVHAFLALPIGAGSAPKQAGGHEQNARVVMSENARQLLKQLRFGRFATATH